jgi:methionyl aminopeptidase
MVQPSVSTQALNDEAARWMQAHGAISATLGYAPPGHPPVTGSICTSFNEVVCHGIPNPKQILKSGNIINIDVTSMLEGYHGDTSRTFLVGQVSAVARKLVEATQESMMRGIV